MAAWTLLQKVARMERMVRDGGAKARRWCCVRWCARKFDGTAEKTKARMEEDGGGARWRSARVAAEMEHAICGGTPAS